MQVANVWCKMEAMKTGWAASLRDLIVMLDGLKRRGAKFRSLTEAIDTETPTGRTIGADDWRAGGTGAQTDQRTYPPPG